ncbi:MAG TPA: TonB-dependent siderophore receptor [Rhodopila sp.]
MAQALAGRPAQGVERSFDIPSQSVADALIQFGRQAGLQASTDVGLVAGQRSAPVKGRMTWEQALATLLAGTGLTYRLNGTMVSVEKPSAVSGSAIHLAPVMVAGQRSAGDAQDPYGPGVGYVATRSTAATKTDTPVIETPHSIAIVTRQQMDDQQPANVGQALRYEPGMTTDATGVDPKGADQVLSRGFLTTEYLDGLVLPSGFFAQPTYDPYMLERIEVLKGATDAVYGPSGPGGAEMLISKRPTETPLHEVFLQGGSYGRIESGFDLSGPLDADKHWLYRLTGVGFDSGTQVDHTNLSRVSIAPALTWRPDDATTLTIFGNYRHDPNAGFWNKRPAVGTLLPNPNGPQIPDNLFTGDLGFNSLTSTQASIGWAFEHRFDDIWTIRQNFRYQYLGWHFDSVQDDELVGSNLIRDKFQDINSSNSITLDNQAEARFDTGPLHHTALAGLEYQHVFLAERDTDTGDGGGNEDVPDLNILAPDYHQVIPAYSPGDTYLRTHQATNDVGVYARDQIAIDQWRVSLGLRQDWSSASTTNFVAGGAQQNQSSGSTTWNAGILYLFPNGIAPYFSYSTSFIPTIGVNAYGAPFQPTTGQQYEAGVKYQPTFMNALFTASVFDLTEQNVLTPDPVDPNNSVQTGEVRSRGIELQAKANVTRNLEVTASYTYLDAHTTKANDGTVGFQPFGVPRHAASAWANYKFDDPVFAGLSVGGGIRYTGDTRDQSNTLHVPAYTLFDAAFRYNVGERIPPLKGMQMDVNVTNLFDKKYIQQCVNGCYWGYRRSVLATLKYNW